ncbi:uncharacterized protein F4822DRAFT_155568 [Hypoxylon trugodes]|uniref:uncharacterized protein n=1 Tax=Hypoxylon trugodes TaxID=326681 RepID=UPI00219D0659|nr:uncharacterized protein F4822DRAFT_155568 [Hypoxylon trugodes]KAI1390605.1 hypothetical protein F4822DRAFT_155568 [Hypoxylon trugodes]
MNSIISTLATFAVLGSTIANPIIQASTTFSFPTNVTGSMTLYAPTQTPTLLPAPVTTSSPNAPKELSICCCCLFEPQPEVPHYIAECPRDGVHAVCGDEVPIDSGYTLGGLEGKPEEIARVCSEVRCGPVKFTG